MKSINDIYRYLLLTLHNAPIHAPRGLKVKEILNATVELHPMNYIITLPGFETNIKYAEIEWEWYKSGTNEIDFHPLIKKIWTKYSDDGKTANSAYGYQMFRKINDEYPYCQVDYVIEKLRLDKDTRQAIININTPEHKDNFYTKDFPCTLSIQFLIRHNALHMIVNMRSNDIFYGYRNDVYCFSKLYHLVYDDLKKYYDDLKVGTYYHNAASLHLYEDQWKKVEELVNGKTKT